MTHSTLFAHLAHRFGAGQENLATEALHFILSGSDAAHAAMLRLARETGAGIPDALSFRTQAGAGDGSIPDLVGEHLGARPLIVEAKFWAGLTENQPVAYLEQLPTEGGLLLFLAPAQRATTLWAELRRRCASAGLDFDERTAPGYLRAASVGGRTLALLSWRALLGALRAAAEAERDQRATSDIKQLEGLCDRMDEGAFLPLRSEELSGDGGRRVVQFCELVDAVAARAFASGLADGSGLRSAGGAGWYGRYLRLSGLVVLVHFSAAKWGTKAATPLWLDYYTSYGKLPRDAVRSALAPLESEVPPRLFLSSQGDLEVPLFVPAGVDRDAAVEALYQQLVEVAARLGTLTPVANPNPAP